MNCAPSNKTEYAFIWSLIDKVPELRPIWDDFEQKQDEFIPAVLMYELAQGLVSFAQDIQDREDKELYEVLSRIYKHLESGLQSPPPCPTPYLIRKIIGDWLGKQASKPNLYAVLMEPMTPTLKEALWPKKIASQNEDQTSSIPLAEPAKTSYAIEVLHRTTWSFALLRIPHSNRHFHATKGSCNLSTSDHEDFAWFGCESEGTWFYGTTLIFLWGDLCRFV